jgi:hypothetical protein
MVMGRGRPPKPPEQRAGHGSVKSTKAILPVDANADKPVPPLPPHPQGEKWKPLALKTWIDLWHSPMSSQYVEADIPGLFRMVILTQAFLNQPTVGVSAELRQLSFNYGLSPMDRRRLQWTIVKSEEAVAQAETRRSRAARIIDGDPREVLE